ncbi:hypothetical protein DPMN_105302 [Dreissena polymorpha]|uniref:Uncharacterized protein n=1 Tax=Dreissena polymorpha TaxID=45954 RepID=A0A9D4HBD1_DREPO|nr:hypothetical protein DPMN_105302 [Dreissena polymorpha]
MSLIRVCGILGMLQIVASFSVTARRQPSGNDGIPELIIFQCDFPIWIRDFYDRLMPDINEEIKSEPGEFCSNISWTDMNSTPWNLAYRRVESFLIGGRSGYNNQLVMNDIEGGYLGRNFKNIVNLEISDLPLKNVTKQLFEGMNRLKHLTFKVKVDFFPLDTFSGLSQLVWFSFEDSMLREISSAHFCRNNQLVFSQLSRNFITTVNGNLTQNCSGSTINSLDLGGNNFSSLTAGMFKDYNVNGVLQISNY